MIKIKFKGTPNLLVRVNKNVPKTRNMKHFRFDSNGIYETENPRLIKLLSRKFETAEETIKEPEHETENKVFKCKKCNFETDNQGILMRHYKDHKKEE